MSGPGPNSLTFDEMEQDVEAGKTQPPVKLEDIKVPEGAEGVPDEFKGKSVAEIIRMTTGSREALQLSETRRRELEDSARNAPPAAAPAAPVADEPKKLTKDELKELYEKDPMAAIEYMQLEAEARVEANVAKRIQPLVAGNVSAAEANAREKHKEDFLLFGDQIEATLKLIPKGNMSHGQAWDDLMAYIRGKPENIDKLFEHRNAKARGTTQAAAQAAQAASAGATVVSSRAAPVAAAKGADGLDDLEREIAVKVNPDLSPDEAIKQYVAWRKVQ